MSSHDSRPDGAALSRSVLGAIMGIVVGGILISLFQMFGHRLVPLPPEIAQLPPERCSDAIKLLRPSQLVLMAGAQFLGAAAGAALAAAVAKRLWLLHSGMVAAVFMAGAVFNVSRCAYPTWYVALSLSSFVAAALVGSRFAAAADERTAS